MHRLTIPGLQALAGSIALFFAFAACGGDDGISPTPSSLTPSQAATVSPTPTPTAPPQLADVLALPGLSDFASQFQQAVFTHSDAQYLIDATHFEDYAGCSDASVATPVYGTCGGIAVPPKGQAITVGLWNSEGEYLSPADYATLVKQYISTDPSRRAYAYTYAIGHEHRGSGENPAGVDVVVDYVRLPNNFPQATPEPGLVLVFRLNPIEGDWRIVGVDQGLLTLVPDFFDWWVPWLQAFPK